MRAEGNHHIERLGHFSNKAMESLEEQPDRRSPGAIGNDEEYAFSSVVFRGAASGNDISDLFGRNRLPSKCRNGMDWFRAHESTARQCTSFQIVCERKPPSTRISVPVTKLLALVLARNTAAPINSPDSPKRPIGVWPRIDLVRSVGEPSSLNSNFRFCSAGKKPGVIEFTRTPFGAHSRARNWVRLSTAALAAE